MMAALFNRLGKALRETLYQTSVRSYQTNVSAILAVPSIDLNVVTIVAGNRATSPFRSPLSLLVPR
jgi:hypothetical protein